MLPAYTFKDAPRPARTCVADTPEFTSDFHIFAAISTANKLLHCYVFVRCFLATEKKFSRRRERKSSRCERRKRGSGRATGDQRQGHHENRKRSLLRATGDRWQRQSSCNGCEDGRLRETRACPAAFAKFWNCKCCDLDAETRSSKTSDRMGEHPQGSSPIRFCGASRKP